MQYVYLIKSKYSYTEVYKIGIANDPQSRLAQLQTGNPYKLEIISCYGFEDASMVEKSLHQAYKSQRLQGEWFELNTVQVGQFETICDLLGGRPAFFDGNATDDEIEEEDDVLLDDGLRIEKRYSASGELRGYAFREKNKNRRLVKFVRRGTEEFEQLSKGLS